MSSCLTSCSLLVCSPGSFFPPLPRQTSGFLKAHPELPSSLSGHSSVSTAQVPSGLLASTSGISKAPQTQPVSNHQRPASSATCSRFRENCSKAWLLHPPPSTARNPGVILAPPSQCLSRSRGHYIPGLLLPTSILANPAMPSKPQTGLCYPLLKTFWWLPIAFRMKNETINLAHR